MQVPRLPKRGCVHGYVGHYIESCAGYVEIEDCQAFSRSALHPIFLSWVTSKYWDEEENRVEYRIENVEALEYPVKYIAFLRTEYADHQKYDREFCEAYCW